MGRPGVRLPSFAGDPTDEIAPEAERSDTPGREPEARPRKMGEIAAERPAGLWIMPRREYSAILNVIRLPKVTPRNAAHAQWSHTLPQDFAETLPLAIALKEDELPDIDEPPVKA